MTLLTCTCTSWKTALSTDTASPGASTSHMLWEQEEKSNRKDDSVLAGPSPALGEFVTLTEDEGQDICHLCCPQGTQGVLAPAPGRNSQRSPPPARAQQEQETGRCCRAGADGPVALCLTLPSARTPELHPQHPLEPSSCCGTGAHQRTESLQHRGDHEVMILQPVLVEQDQVQRCQKQTPRCVNPGRSCWASSENIPAFPWC